MRISADALLSREREILERVAQSLPLRETLESLALLMDELLSGCCCILRAASNDLALFEMVTGPTLPQSCAAYYLRKDLDSKLDPCSLAVKSGKLVVVTDARAPGRWRSTAWARVAVESGILSCCAMPILSRAGKRLGVLAVHRAGSTLPGTDGLQLLERFKGLARIALERAQVDEALLDQQAEFRRALEHLTQAQRLSHTGSFTTNVEEDDHVWSDELYRVLEFEPGSKVKFQSFRALINPEDLPGFDAGFRRALTEGIDFDRVFRIVTPKGTAKYLHAVSHFSESTRGSRIVSGSIQDVTASRAAEDALKAREGELQRAMAQLAEGQRLSSTGSFTSDIQRDQHSWSAEFYRIFEIDPATRPNVQAIRAMVHPDDLDLFDMEIRRGMAGCEADFNFRILTSGGRLKYLRGVAHLMEHVGGRPIFMGTVQDISDRKAAEEARDRARNELAHVARAAALSALTASIAHEVNQPLAGIFTNASTCLRMLASVSPDIEGAKVTVQRTIRDADRASAVIKRLRALFAGKPMRKGHVDLNDAVREVLSLTAGELQKERVVLNTELSAGLPAVLGDKVQLQQVILNLVLNACEAMRVVDHGVRKLTIVTSRLESEAAVAVSDTGIGAPIDSLEKMFSAFYTTKAEGMGIGLSISRSIIEDHGGRLAATRNIGPGLTFSVSIPVPS